MKTLFRILMAIFFVGCVSQEGYPAAVIFSGDEVKAFKQNLNLNDAVKILSGTDNPTSVAKDAPKGSIYLELTNGDVYKKNDAGSSTNWTKLATGSSTGLNLVETSDFESGIQNWTASGGTFVQTTTAAEVLFDTASARWTPSGAQTLTSDAVTIPNGLEGKNCDLSLTYLDGESSKYTLEIFDGTNVLESVDLPIAATSKKVSVSFVCPTSGTLAARLSASASASAISIDNVVISDNKNIGTVEQAVLVAQAFVAHTASCAWVRTSTTLGAFSTDTDCPGVTSEFTGGGVGIDATDTDLPELNLTTLSPGRYKVTAIFLGTQSVATGRATYAINDGTDTRGHVTNRESDATEGGPVTLVAYFEYTTAKATNTFAIHGSATSAGDVNIDLLGTTGDSGRLNWIVERFPLDSQLVIKPEDSGWHIDANISGGTPLLGSADVSTYTGITNSSLTLTLNSGSAPVDIACSGTEVASGTTCSADESVGFSTEIPVAGKYVACMDYNYTGGDGSAINLAMQLVETPNNAQTISQEGNDRKAIAMGATDDVGFPWHICGYFEFASAGTKTIRLFYEQDGDGSIDASELRIDGAAGVGQRDLHIFMFPVVRNQQVQVIDQVVTAGGNDQFNDQSAELNCDGASAITDQDSSTFVSSIANISSGTCVVTLDSTAYSAAPRCQFTVKATTGLSIPGVSVTSATSVTIACEDNAGSDCASFDGYLSCRGPR